MDIEPEVIEAPEVEEVEQPEVEAEEAEEAALVVEIDGDDEEEADVGKRNMRNRIKELTAKLKEHESKAVAQAAPALRAKPTEEEHDYNFQTYTEDLEKWWSEKAEHDARDAERKAIAERVEQRWQQRLSYYDEGRSKLGAQDYEDAEAVVAEILAPAFPGFMAEDVRMGIIKQGAKDPAALVYALGKNPAKAKELAAIDDPVEFAFKLGAMEATMKVTRGGPKPPAPEKRIAGGSAPGVTAVNDPTLARLEAEAEKTGNYTELARYKRQARG